MCGICGFTVDNKIGIRDWNEVLGKMKNILAHRGPDTQGQVYEDTNKRIVGLGHRRLSIIDLSEKANQPLGNEDDSVIVILNGEIYNYQQLTKELVAGGHIFRSQSDTEVIVHLYEDLEDGCLNKLDGMFAFVLWDKKRGRLLLARDPIGIKPLFYVFKEGNFYFASEIKALLLLDEVSRQIDLKALDYYLTYGYIPGSRTIFRDISKLPPASYLTFENRQTNITPYWSIQYLPKNDLPEDALTEALFNTCAKAVKRHLVSDVPLGAFLSGGVDSSIIVALMSMVGEKPFDTFSLGYASGGKDELDYAASVADHFATTHHEFKVDPEMTQILPELLWHLDEPFFDNSIIPTYYISKLAREKVKVVLSGDGGDEIFGGYGWTRRHQYSVAYGMLPGFIRKPLAKLCSGVGPEDDYRTNLTTKARRFLGDLNADVESGFLRRTSVSYSFEQRLFTQALKDELREFDAGDYQRKLFSDAQVLDAREKMLYVDTIAFLPDDCLFKVDRMSMAHGLEVRVPFLDKDLVEFSARIPFEYKIRGLNTKYILKKTFAPYLPKNILRQRKQGFTIPISAWLRAELGDLATRILLSNSLEKRGLFERKRLKWMLEEHRIGRQELGHRIWSLVVFEVWARLYLDEKIKSAPQVSLQEMIE
ncbi:MAG: asparagine synthase (glutamine-hydrolyzing) [Deltaproteobacteria bacterium]|nr:MAG: asparagine synthase (glutamine-hydrolyzing) [Deltaproteobacteria bacterium]